MERGKREEIYSYADLQELAARVGAFLVGEGVTAGERVMLFAKNAPEWAMAYFGILKAGATAVPVAHESTVAELVNIARASGAVGFLIGDDLLDKRDAAWRAPCARRAWRPRSGPSTQVVRARRRGGRAGAARRRWSARQTPTRWRR